MTPVVRLHDGVEVTFASGDAAVLDGAASGNGTASGPGDAVTTVLTHAHADHLVRGVDRVVASELTAALAGARGNGTAPATTDHPQVELHDAGHVAGSRAARLTDPDTGRIYLYTGDCCTRDRFYLDGFEPVDADVLVVESTYGKPEYRFPPVEEVTARVHDWLAETTDAVAVLHGYALGRAQKLLHLLDGSARTRAFTTEAVAAVCDVVESHLDVGFDYRQLGPDVDPRPGDALVLPGGAAGRTRVESLVGGHDVVTAGFSGWAVDDSFVYRRGYDEGFVLTDHCDFAELVDLVRAVDPERVYTHHGFAEAFARHLTRTEGYETRALKRDQSTLADF